jgi:hypothetical protein
MLQRSPTASYAAPSNACYRSPIINARHPTCIMQALLFVEDSDQRDILDPGSFEPTTVEVLAMRAVRSPGLVVRSYMPKAAALRAA